MSFCIVALNNTALDPWAFKYFLDTCMYRNPTISGNRIHVVFGEGVNRSFFECHFMELNVQLYTVSSSVSVPIEQIAGEINNVVQRIDNLRALIFPDMEGLTTKIVSSMSGLQMPAELTQRFWSIVDFIQQFGSLPLVVVTREDRKDGVLNGVSGREFVRKFGQLLSNAQPPHQFYDSWPGMIGTPIALRIDYRPRRLTLIDS